MSSVVIAGDTSGTCTLQAPAVAGSTVLTLPASTGTVATLGTALTSATAQASTSGTSIDFTGIPSWVKRITVMFNGVSTNGIDNWIFQLADSGIVRTSGYASQSSIINSGVGTTSYSTGFGIRAGQSTTVLSGVVTLLLLNSSSNIWVASGLFADGAGNTFTTGGSKTLSGSLDRVRITTLNGTDTFDAGSINIMYE